MKSGMGSKPGTKKMMKKKALPKGGNPAGTAFAPAQAAGKKAPRPVAGKSKSTVAMKPRKKK